MHVLLAVAAMTNKLIEFMNQQDSASEHWPDIFQQDTLNSSPITTALSNLVMGLNTIQVGLKVCHYHFVEQSLFKSLENTQAMR